MWEEIVWFWLFCVGYEIIVDVVDVKGYIDYVYIILCYFQCYFDGFVDVYFFYVVYGDDVGFVFVGNFDCFMWDLLVVDVDLNKVFGGYVGQVG